MLLSFQYSVSCSHPESDPSHQSHHEKRGCLLGKGNATKNPHPYKRPELFIDPVIDAILTALFVRLP
jgi:hypothetical protein